jgi:hypothetical protein
LGLFAQDLQPTPINAALFDLDASVKDSIGARGFVDGFLPTLLLPHHPTIFHEPLVDV